MWRASYLQFIFLVLAGLFAACGEGTIPPVTPVEPIEEPGGGSEPIDTTGNDTSGHYEPDTVIVDTLKPRTSNALLAASKGFGLANLYTEAQLSNKTGNYASARDYLGRNVDLDYSFLAPANDTLKYRPFVLMVHEGALIFGNLGNELGKARWLARKGYAAAAINYRLGFNGGTQYNSCGGNNREVLQAIYRGVQDTYKALHYFADRSEEFGIDPGQMMLAGSSAGAIIISALVYMDQDDFEAMQPGIVQALGELDPMKSGTEYRVRALLTYQGYAVFRTNNIWASNAKPTVFFQGTNDTVLPYKQGNLFSCGSYYYMLGAEPTADRLKNMKVPYELNYQPGKGHTLSYTEEHVANHYAQFMKRFWSGNKRQTTIENFKTLQDIQLP
jgi:acetyl esterase/lipase